MEQAVLPAHSESSDASRQNLRNSRMVLLISPSCYQPAQQYFITQANKLKTS